MGTANSELVAELSESWAVDEFVREMPESDGDSDILRDTCGSNSVVLLGTPDALQCADFSLLFTLVGLLFLDLKSFDTFTGCILSLGLLVNVPRLESSITARPSFFILLAALQNFVSSLL